jgi:hypothetical protein
MRHFAWLVAVHIVLATSATATPYWVDYEASSGLLPEDSGQGWHRVWGDWQGLHHGIGANRTIENGILTYDSLYDGGVYDFSENNRPGEIDPDPGELFVMEWRLLVEQDNSNTGDVGVGVASDAARLLGLRIRPTEMRSVFEDGVLLPIAPGVFHDYRVTSADMITYRLFIDGAERRVGSFWQGASNSFVNWGDGTQSFGGGSLHQWSYVRFGVVPEPGALALLGAVIACRVRARR